MQRLIQLPGHDALLPVRTYGEPSEQLILNMVCSEHNGSEPSSDWECCLPPALARSGCYVLSLDGDHHDVAASDQIGMIDQLLDIVWAELGRADQHPLLNRVILIGVGQAGPHAVRYASARAQRVRRAVLFSPGPSDPVIEHLQEMSMPVWLGWCKDDESFAHHTAYTEHVPQLTLQLYPAGGPSVLSEAIRSIAGFIGVKWCEADTRSDKSWPTVKLSQLTLDLVKHAAEDWGELPGDSETDSDSDKGVVQLQEVEELQEECIAASAEAEGVVAATVPVAPKASTQRNNADWDSFDVDAECERIDDEERRERGLTDREITQEKILDVMKNEELSEKQKMEKCMHMVGHKDYQFVESKEDKARREAQELLNNIQDPRVHPRDKMHLLGKAYHSSKGAKGETK